MCFSLLNKLNIIYSEYIDYYLEVGKYVKNGMTFNTTLLSENGLKPKDT